MHSRLRLVSAIGILTLIIIAACTSSVWESVVKQFSSGNTAAGNPIVVENQNPGTDRWKSPNFDEYVQNSVEEELAEKTYAERSAADSGSALADPGVTWTDTQKIKGYASQASINVGESINFHISSNVPFYDLVVYRVGWYGGDGARWMAEADHLAGTNYGIPAPDPVTGMVEAHWPVAYTLQTTTSWTSGIYLVWLTESGVNSNEVSYIIFVVRDDARVSDILYQVPFTTYQAYNSWGGKSLYDYNSVDDRASQVSFDRPYDHDDGSGLFFSGDYNMVRWMEKQGYDVTYTTSVDLDRNPNLMNNHKVFLSNFHDEYWSWNMFNNAQAARDQGKHLLFFDSNNIYWQIRFAPSSTGVAGRVIICYKNAATDPMSTSSTPWLTTVLWRDPPVNRPENALLGVMFQDAMGFGENYPWVVTNASHWFYEGTGLQNGDTIPLLVGYEFDRVWNNGLTPPNLEVLSHSPAPEPYGSYSNAAMYVAPSGALVFNASTNYWAYMLDGNWIWPQDARVQRMTTNLFNHVLNLSGPISTSTPTNTRTPTLTPSPGPSPTPTNTATATNTATPSNTPTASNTPTSTFTPSPTFTPSNTPTPTNTPLPGTKTFYRGINVNGAALVIDGNNWEAGTAPGFSINGTKTCNQSVTLNPATDAARAQMIRCSSSYTALNAAVTIPNGNYDVYLYFWEHDTYPDTYDICIENNTVRANYTTGSVGTWQRLGPWTVDIIDGSLNVKACGGFAELSGIEIWSNNLPPQVNPTATPVTPPISNQLPAGSTFYRAINLNGAALQIDGNAWESSAASGYTVNGYATCKQTIALNPPTDAARAEMIRCYRYGTNMSLTVAVPNGVYSVYLYNWEDNYQQTFDLSLQGQVIVTDFNSGTPGTWQRTGPWTITVVNGLISVGTCGGYANLSGIEIWSANGSGASSASLMGAPAPTATSTATDMPSPTATVTPSDTPTAAPTETPTPESSAGIVVESDTVTRTDGWTVMTQPEGASGGSYLINSSPDDTLTLGFTGTQVSIIYIQGPSFGAFTAELDGIAIQTITTNTPVYEMNVGFTLSGLGDGVHTLRILPVGGVVAIDAFIVSGVADVVPPTEEILPTVPPTLDIGTLEPMPTDTPPTEEILPTVPPTLEPTPTDVPVTPPVSDNLDTGADNWLSTSGWTWTPAAAYGGVGYGWSMTGAYSGEVLRWNTSIDLRSVPSIPGVGLSFLSRLNLVSGEAHVELSTDGGSQWLIVGVVQPSADWTLTTIDLSAFVGQVIQLQFVWQPNATASNADVSTTWWIDSLSVALYADASTPLPTVTLAPTGIVPPTPQPTWTATPLPAPTSVPPTPTPLPTETPQPTATTPPTEVPTESSPSENK
ncbi:MAG: DUF6605 domain-containing protein [Anaerolineae bacterium]